MTTELLVLLGITAFLTTFLSVVFWLTLSTIRAAHKQEVDSLRADQKALHLILKETNNRIQAKSLTDFLTLQAHNGGTEVYDEGRMREGNFPQGDVMSRSDAVEAEIAANRMGGGVP